MRSAELCSAGRCDQLRTYGFMRDKGARGAVRGGEMWRSERLVRRCADGRRQARMKTVHGRSCWPAARTDGVSAFSGRVARAGALPTPGPLHTLRRRSQAAIALA